MATEAIDMVDAYQQLPKFELAVAQGKSCFTDVEDNPELFYFLNHTACVPQDPEIEDQDLSKTAGPKADNINSLFYTLSNPRQALDNIILNRSPTFYASIYWAGFSLVTHSLFILSLVLFIRLNKALNYSSIKCTLPELPHQMSPLQYVSLIANFSSEDALESDIILLSKLSTINTCNTTPCPSDFNQALKYLLSTNRMPTCLEDRYSPLDAKCSWFDILLVEISLLIIIIGSIILGQITAVTSYLHARTESLYAALPYNDFSLFDSLLFRIQGFLVFFNKRLISLYLILFILPVYLTATNHCYESEASSEQCSNFSSQCRYNKIINCRTYTSSLCDTYRTIEATESGTLNPKNCELTDDNNVLASKFAGLIDVRLIYTTPCEICRTLDDQYNGREAIVSVSTPDVDCPAKFRSKGFCPTFVPSNGDKCSEGEFTSKNFPEYSATGLNSNYTLSFNIRSNVSNQTNRSQERLSLKKDYILKRLKNSNELNNNITNSLRELRRKKSNQLISVDIKNFRSFNMSKWKDSITAHNQFNILEGM